jgi:hypothetical protein
MSDPLLGTISRARSGAPSPGSRRAGGR